MTTSLMSLEGKNVAPETIQAIESALIRGDLKLLTPQQRVVYYNHVCESVGLNPLTRPFDYIILNGKEVLYARKDASDQLRKIHQVSINIREQKWDGDLYIVTVNAKDKNGKEDEDVGAVSISAKGGDARANGIMKAITKAKRRVTLSICGLGMLDETELETIPGAQAAADNQKVADKTAAKTESLKAQIEAPKGEPEKAKEPEVVKAPVSGPKPGRESKPKKAAPPVQEAEVVQDEPEQIPPPAEQDNTPIFDNEDLEPAPAKKEPTAEELRSKSLGMIKGARSIPELKGILDKVNEWSRAGSFKLNEIPVPQAKAFIDDIKRLKDERKRDLENA